jgi:hypothetical protein
MVLGIAGTGKNLAGKATARVPGVPLLKLMAERIGGLRNWSKGRARLATSPVVSRELEDAGSVGYGWRKGNLLWERIPHFWLLALLPLPSTAPSLTGGGLK